MGERRRRRFGGVKAGVAGLMAVGVLGAVFAPSALAEISGSSSSGSASAQQAATAGAPGGGSMAASPHVAKTAPSNWNAAAAAKFWTPARLAAATPVDDTPKATTAAGAHTATSTSIARASHFSGASSTGIIAYASQDMTTHYCTASVVDSNRGNLIIMAAHCNPGSWMAYVPKYQHGAAHQPYGVWAVTKVFKDSHYSGIGSGSDYDYAFAQVAPNSQGRQIQKVTGGNWLSHPSSYSMYPTVLGYPKISADSADEAIRCRPNGTSRLSGYRQMVMYCSGFFGGTSGGPWLLGFNGNTGYLVGITGGLDTGGPNSWTNYSPFFDSRVFTLFNWAQSH